MLPPGFECSGVEVRAMSVVVEPQTEARAAQSQGPDFCVLAMTALRLVLPLVCKMRGDRCMGPLEGIVAVANHLEGFIPAIVITIIERNPSVSRKQPL